MHPLTLSRKKAMLKRYRQLTWVVLGLWYLFCLATLDYNGPFLDEGIYITAGARTLEGHGLSDGYLGWFAGSLLWPTLAGIASRIGGLAGARALAALFAAIALLACARATANLFGEAAGFWAALALALNAPLLALARMSVYDSTALAGMAASFWAITELHQRDYRFWLAIAATSFTIGMFAKYPTGLMLLPLMAILFLLRKGKALADAVFFGLISMALALAFLLPVREQIAPFFAYRLTNSPASGVSRAMIAVDMWNLSAVHLALAAGGWVAAKDKRALATVLILNLLLWPAYHLVLRESVSRNKHLVLGFAFAYPLFVCLLSRLWQGDAPFSRLRRATAIALVLVLGAIGTTQLARLNRAWPDVRSAVGYLTERVQPGEKLLISQSWPYTMYLYMEDNINSPWDVFDVYRIAHGQSEIDLCEYDWFVDAQDIYGWPTSVREKVQRCGTFYPVFSTTSDVENMGLDLDYVRYTVQTTVWQNTQGR
jgi:hypothetical protein